MFGAGPVPVLHADARPPTLAYSRPQTPPHDVDGGPYRHGHALHTRRRADVVLTPEMREVEKAVEADNHSFAPFSGVVIFVGFIVV